MIFLLFFGPQNVYLKYDRLFPKHPVYIRFRGAKCSPSSICQAFFFSIRCLLVIIHSAKLSHELRLGSTDSTAILFETWIKPIIIWRRQYSSVDLSTSMLLPMFFDPFHFLNGAQNVDCRMACHSGATPLGPPFYQELVNNTEIQIPS